MAEEKSVFVQIEERGRRLAESLDGFERCIAVSSGKGGVGKSTIASLLALAFQKLGVSPVVLDCDLNGPCQTHVMGLTPSLPESNVHGMVVSRSRCGVGIVSVGSWILPGRSFEFESHAPEAGYVWRTAREFSLLSDILTGTDWGPFSTLILDLPPGSERMGHFARHFGTKLSFIVVTTPSVMAFRVVTRSLSGLQQAGARVLGYIENMKGYYCSECRSTRPLFNGPPDLPWPIPLLGSLPFDPRLADACEKGLTDTILSEPPGETAMEIARKLMNGDFLGRTQT